MLRRSLFEGEVVHHIDKNTINNSEDNLMVFRTNSDHSSFHKSSNPTLVENVDGSYSCAIVYSNCLYCGVQFKPSQLKVKFCSLKCSSLSQRLVKRPSKEELNRLLIENNFEKVGRKFNVSGNAIRKWCVAYGMSNKAKDYK